MERIYIIPQLLEPDDLQQAEGACFACMRYVELRYYPTAVEMEDSERVSGVRKRKNGG